VLAPASIDGAQCRPAGCVASHPGHRCTSRSPKGSRSRTSVRWSRRDGGGSAGAGGPRGGWLWFFGKIRRSAGRDRAPQTQRRCGMVDGRRCGWWWLTAGRTPGLSDCRGGEARATTTAAQRLRRNHPPASKRCCATSRPFGGYRVGTDFPTAKPSHRLDARSILFCWCFMVGGRGIEPLTPSMSKKIIAGPAISKCLAEIRVCRQKRRQRCAAD
jgi:hypothetical protein